MSGPRRFDSNRASPPSSERVLRADAGRRPNEFCAPALAEVVSAAIGGGATQIRVVPTMLTPGGVHSEVEIPEVMAHLRAEHPSVELRYAWPFDLAEVARLLAAQVARSSG